MADFKRRAARDLRHPILRWKTSCRKVIGIVLLILAIAGFVLFGVARKQLKTIESNLKQMTQGCLEVAMTAYDGIDMRSADVTGHILPVISENFYRAQALDDAIVDLFGASHEIFPDHIHQAFLETMQEYDRAARTGQSTDTARAMLDACVEDLRVVWTTRFDVRGEMIEAEP